MAATCWDELSEVHPRHHFNRQQHCVVAELFLRSIGAHQSDLLPCIRAVSRLKTVLDFNTKAISAQRECLRGAAINGVRAAPVGCPSS